MYVMSDGLAVERHTHGIHTGAAYTLSLCLAACLCVCVLVRVYTCVSWCVCARGALFKYVCVLMCVCGYRLVVAGGAALALERHNNHLREGATRKVAASEAQRVAVVN